SGTSMDGVDAALVAFGDRRCDVLNAQNLPYTDALRDRLLQTIRTPGSVAIDDLGRLDADIGGAFRDAALQLLETAGRTAQDVVAIGSHGQTIRHRTQDDLPFSWQFGDPNIIAAGTGIATVADLRRRDIAEHGEGAPLAPAFHHWLFGNDENCVVLNLGGIANVTILDADPARVRGYDTGPANTLMDAWARRHLQKAFDQNGSWAASGSTDESLLDELLADPWFARPPPKSTGFEDFNLDWLDDRLGGREIEPAHVQATLLALTCRSVAEAIRRDAPDTAEVIVCGGGVHNAVLMAALGRELAPIRVASIAERGIDPDWVEAALFAWLARETLAGRPGNLPSVTGAARPVVLGAVYAGAAAIPTIS
ncbi:MAG: anhydro-N-acetylmuramic acid kinase, partial [Woeseiaceae bacterium]|nr:anhydro-N-acetylmuramic acid kinase [Woeseiaceae bacterium]